MRFPRQIIITFQYVQGPVTTKVTYNDIRARTEPTGSRQRRQDDGQMKEGITGVGRDGSGAFSIPPDPIGIPIVDIDDTGSHNLAV